MPKQTSLTIRVEGGRSAEFPIDMLRYDRATPHQEKDSSAISRGFESVSADDTRRRTVELVVTANGAPSVPRWESFGWKVTHVHDGYDWRLYNGITVRK